MNDQSGNLPEGRSHIVLYQTEDGRSRVQVRMEAGTVWLSLNQIVELYRRDKSVISRHIKNIGAGRRFDGVVSWIQALDFAVTQVPEAKVCKECDLKMLCTTEGVLGGVP